MLPFGSMNTTLDSSWLPEPVQELLRVALVGELTVIRPDGRAESTPQTFGGQAAA